MASLASKSPCEGLLPIEVEGARLVEELPAAITSVAPFRGCERSVSAALEEAIGAALPGPGGASDADGGRIVWSGPGQAMVLGRRVAPEGAAVTDQSDAFAVLRLSGPSAEPVLARLVPLDLRPAAFPPGDSARTMIEHMNCTITALGGNTYQIMVFRSMAKTVVDKLAAAMHSFAARTALGRDRAG